MDPYVYPNTTVLRNLRDIRDPDRLARFEMDMASSRIAELSMSPRQGGFDTRHLQAIHRYLFQDVYRWAGEFRSVEISKTGALFAFEQHIAPSLDRTFQDLKRENRLEGLDRARFCNRGAYYLGELNAIHPFRDGNGRTLREFVRQLTARNGYEIDWTHVSRGEMIDASRESFRKGNSGLELVLRFALDTEANQSKEWRDADA